MPTSPKETALMAIFIIAIGTYLAAILTSAKRSYDDPWQRYYSLPWWGYAGLAVMVHCIVLSVLI